MYSVVLMMAMTGSGDAPAGLFHHDSCCGGGGCCGGVVYSSCCGGGHGKLFGGLLGHKHHSSCCGGGVSSGCCGGYASCTGSVPYMGCTGSMPYGGCAGCVGAPMMTPVTPTTPPVEKEKEKIPAPKPEEVSAPATLVVNVPANAVLTVDGVVTTSTSSRRVFESPVLEAGKEFHYTLKASFTRDGQSVSVSKIVTVKAGLEAVVDFTDAAVASR